MLRKIIITLLAVLFLVGSYFIGEKMAASRNIPKPQVTQIVTPVSTIFVTNKSVPITLKTSGNIVAKNKVDIFSEVLGVFESSAHDFKPGSRYRQGETLLRINSDELRANLKAQKSGLVNQITLLLPDLKLDYPASFDQWNQYISNFDIDRSLSPLPTAVSEREKLFILGKGIHTTFYNIQNLETRLLMGYLMMCLSILEQLFAMDRSWRVLSALLCMRWKSMSMSPISIY